MKDAFLTIVCPHYKMTKEQFIHRYYDGEGAKIPMCAKEISEMIFNDTGYHISRQAIHKWAIQHANRIRSHKEGFRLAVVKKRVDHEQIAGKIDYVSRRSKINYYENARKRRKTMSVEKRVTVRLIEKKWDWLHHFCKENGLNYQGFFERCLEYVMMHENEVKNGVADPVLMTAMKDMFIRTTMPSQATPPNYRKEMDELKAMMLEIKQGLQKPADTK